jgi:hypothetical protein
MTPELKAVEWNAINCEDCGKTNGQGEIGTHWICGDCKVDGPQNDDALEVEL